MIFFSCLSIPCFSEFLGNVSSIFCYSGNSNGIDIRGRSTLKIQIPWAGEFPGSLNYVREHATVTNTSPTFLDTSGANCLNIWLIPVTQNTLHKVTKNKPPKDTPNGDASLTQFCVKMKFEKMVRTSLFSGGF